MRDSAHEKIIALSDRFAARAEDEGRSASFRCRIKETLLELIEDNRLTSHFQPIVSLRSEKIFGFEGLCRTIGKNPFGNIEELFEQARFHNSIYALDMLCRENTIKHASQLGIHQLGAVLAINVCPTSLLQNEHSPGETERMVKQWGLAKEKVILELTEQEAVSNYTLFQKAISHYRNMGFKIAIDDFGAGYGGLKMLSIIAPDYVKIDRHFFRDSTTAHINRSLTESIVTICYRLGIDVIAEGIETPEDVDICNEFGIDLIQGYHFARPENRLIAVEEIGFSSNGVKVDQPQSFGEAICIEDIVSYAQPVDVSERVLCVHELFTNNPQLYCLPVLEGEKVCGMINRHRFMEEHMVGRHGYGMNLNYYKRVRDILDGRYLQVPSYMPIEEVANRINSRESLSLYDDVCVTRSGKYVGTVAVSSILQAVTNNSILHARGANPLTGLPGNEFIQREIAKMLSQSMQFDVCYIDIDTFKPYNDKHGFALGDEVIKTVGRIIKEAVKYFCGDNIGFAGHIGGDDFIMIVRPKHSIVVAERVIEKFRSQINKFHPPEIIKRGCYTALSRDGKPQQFGLLSLSIGIVSTEIHHINSVAQISSIASDLKKRAKDIRGNSIVRDRRGGE